MDQDLIFEDPTPAARGVTGESPVGLWLAALREHPGCWSKWPHVKKTQMNAASIATRIRKGGYGVAAGEFEAVTRKTSDGAVLFARYVGGGSE